MRTAFVTVKHDGLEGRFMVGQWTPEDVGRRYPHQGDGGPYGFLDVCGWGLAADGADAILEYALVMEINGTPCEGSIFAIGGDPSYDLGKCQMPRFGYAGVWRRFLGWLYANLYSAGRGPGQLALGDLPELLDLSDAAIQAATGKEAHIG